MHLSYTAIVRSEFDKGKELTLAYLYDIVSKNPQIQLDQNKLKHRIRSTVYGLQKTHEIVRIGNSTYKKVNK